MKIAVVQMDILLGQPERNLAAMLNKLRETRSHGAELTIFPECALTGYCFADLNSARPSAQSIPGPATEAFSAVLAELGGAAIFGMLESADAGGVFNAALLVNGDGVVSSYRKIHLPFLGVDQFACYGDRPFAVAAIDDMQIGLGICYDSGFPEAMRLLKLAGADLIALPTNFPTGAEGMVEHVIRTRSLENHVYFACCNRVGDEAGFRFIGRSQIVDPTGKVLALASDSRAEILYADVDAKAARAPRENRGSAKNAVDRMADRRPEMYDGLSTPHTLRRARDEST